METCETKPVLFTQCGTDPLCLCAGLHDQKPHGAGDTLAFAQNKQVLILAISCNTGHSMVVVAKVVVAMVASKVMRSDRVHPRIATSFPHALRSTKTTHATASHCQSARRSATGKTRYLMYVAIL